MEHNPHNETFDGPGAILSDLFKQTIAWLKANGINPNRLPADPQASLVGDQLTFIEKVSPPDNPRVDILDPTGMEVLKETRTVTITVPPPPLVATWLAPKCPTCGR